MTTVNDLLDALNDLNAEGRIQYEDYSYLHDLATTIESAPPPDLDALLSEADEMDAGVLVTRYDQATGTFVKEPSIVARLAAAIRSLTTDGGSDD